MFQVLALYKGVTSPVLGISAQNALVFGLQRNAMNIFGHDISGEFQAGCASGALQTLIATPVELSKIQMQMQNIGVRVSMSQRKFGPVSILLHLYRKEGLPGAFRGFGSNFVRDCPSYGIYFASYAYFCELLAKEGQSRHSVSPLHMLLAGGLCGMISWTVCFPVDVVKTRVQTEGFQPHGRYKNYAECIRECCESGMRVFTRGLGPTLIRSFPVNAVTLCTASMIERFLHQNTPNISGATP